jgi:hypothetical protein
MRDLPIAPIGSSAVESAYNDLLNTLGRIARGDSRGGTGELLRLMRVAQEALDRAAP